MTEKQKSKYKVIKILDPLLCVKCESAYVADVQMSDGERKKMFYCSRKDCDNWATENDFASTNDEWDLAA